MSIHSTFYADNSRLQGYKNTNDQQSLGKVAKEFEGLYLQMLLKSMREAGQTFSSGMLKNDHISQYQEMYHNQLALHIANNSDIGLAAAINKQMTPHVSATTTPMPKAMLNKQATTQQLHDFTTFATPREFIDKMTPTIKDAAAQLGVAPNLLLAQAALESGWGQHAQDSHNLFGIKADKVWQKAKDYVNTSTHEFVAGVKTKLVDKFRAYPDYVASVQDYVGFIKDNPRYQQALQVAANPQEYVQELQRAGYATDPDYAAKVMKIYDKIEAG